MTNYPARVEGLTFRECRHVVRRMYDLANDLIDEKAYDAALEIEKAAMYLDWAWGSTQPPRIRSTA